MKTYRLTNKWIKNKYTLPFVILNIIGDIILPDRKDTTKKQLRREILEAFHDISYCLINIIKFENDPLDNISGYDPLETLDKTHKIIDLDNSINKIIEYIDESITIELVDLREFNEFLPDFKNKVIYKYIGS